MTLDPALVHGGPLSSAEIELCARLHQSEMGDDKAFLSSLGERFVKLLYEHVASSRLCAVFIAYEASEVATPLGYICGTVDTARLYREFVRRSWWRAVPALASRLCKPTVARRAFETIRYPGRSDPTLPRAEILNFVVVPAARGSGVAPMLFTRLMGWFGSEGCSAVKIVTGERRARAHRLYEKMGARLHGAMSIHEGSSVRIYVYSLNEGVEVGREVLLSPEG